MHTNKLLAHALDSVIARSAIKLLGRKFPLPDEVSKAQALLDDAPRHVSPIEVAEYFESLTTTNADEDLFNREWPVRANPLIVAFFVQATDHESSEIDGDQTPWCAAFVNWCLERAGYLGTRSWSSKSFRSVEYSAVPAYGDIAVFADVKDDRDGNTGHVGFWCEGRDREVIVLGGNQRQRVCRRKYATIEQSSRNDEMTRRYLGARKTF